MKLYANPTSPFVRIVRMGLYEKGLADEIGLVMVDPWADEREFLDANPAGRVPALVTDDGVKLSEALLILRHLEAVRPDPAILPEDAQALSCAGLAIGVFDAAVAVIIGRKSAPDFDSGMVGRKRYRTMKEGLARLDAAVPEPRSGRFDLAAIAAITALDYLMFRFPEHDWRAMAPSVAALRDANAERRAVAETVPRT